MSKVGYEWCGISFGGEFSVKYESHVIACAFLYGASQDLKLPIDPASDGTKWWESLLAKDQCTPVTELQLNDTMQEFYAYCPNLSHVLLMCYSLLEEMMLCHKELHAVFALKSGLTVRMHLVFVQQ